MDCLGNNGCCVELISTSDEDWAVSEEDSEKEEEGDEIMFCVEVEFSGEWILFEGMESDVACVWTGTSSW